MKKLLSNFYTHALFHLYLSNSAARGVTVSQSLESILADFWEGNVSANVPEEELPAKTLENLYELASSDMSDALVSAKSMLQ